MVSWDRFTYDITCDHMVFLDAEPPGPATTGGCCISWCPSYSKCERMAASRWMIWPLGSSRRMSLNVTERFEDLWRYDSSDSVSCTFSLIVSHFIRDCSLQHSESWELQISTSNQSAFWQVAALAMLRVRTCQRVVKWMISPCDMRWLSNDILVYVYIYIYKYNII